MGMFKYSKKKKRRGGSIDGGLEAYLIDQRSESFQKPASQLSDRQKDSGASVAPPQVLRDNSLKSKKFRKMEGLRSRTERRGLGVRRKAEKVKKREKFSLL